ncbi:STAGA complex 65 subunit gamma-like [Ptychodera flava]|uniref:STAGA complex 65 subunit gamma-like n=1 Tax=Ptychodera flava TaxID=63121 RepID=UPI003969E45F
MTSRWGDLPGPSSPAVSVVEVELPFVQPQPMEIEAPRLHQPSQQRSTVTQLPAELCQQDPISIHTIQLLKHNRKVRSMISLAQQHHHQQDHKSTEKELSRLPSLPTPLTPSRGVRPWENSERLQMDTIELHDATVRQLTRRAVATICAHAGFENCQESVLETLTDALGDYNQKVCQLLRYAVDREALTGSTGFQDVLQQVFHEIGISSFKTLQVFWETRIRNYHKQVHNRALQLRQEYEKHRNPKGRSNEDHNNVRIKEEPLSEIQFPLGDSEGHEPSENLLDLHSISSALDLEESSCSSNVTDPDSPQWSLSYIKTEAQDRVSALDSLSESVVEQQDYTTQNDDEESKDNSMKNSEGLSPLPES